MDTAAIEGGHTQPQPVEPPVEAGGEGRSRGRRRRPLGFVVAAAWLVTVVGAAVLADLLPIPSPSERAGPGNLAPFREWGWLVLGTDRLGRSQLSRLVFGARASLTVGIVAAGIGVVVGGLLGLVAGYFRGWVDAVLGALANMVLAMPGLVLLLAIAAVFTPSLTSLLVGLGLLAIPAFLRIARASTLTHATREFVTAAKALGASTPRVLGRELLPVVVLPVLAYAFLLIAILIAAEGSLSYLGVGVPPPTPSWGSMIADGQRDLRANPHLLFVPAVTMFLTIYSLNVVGDHARRLVNVREVGT